MMKKWPKGCYGLLLYAVILTAMVIFLLVQAAAPHKTEAAAATVPLPILMYHDIQKEPCPQDQYTITPQQLEADLCALQADGWQTVTLAQIYDYVDQGCPLPEKPILLVFDDGYQSVLSEALPLLKKYQATAVVSVIGARAQNAAADCAEDAQYLNWQELQQVADSGLIELQSHSANLHVYQERKGLAMLPEESTEAYTQVIMRDIQAMDQLTKTAQVQLFPAFAYPYGFVEPLADAILQNNGYLMTMTSEETINALSQDPSCLYQMGRFHRSGQMSTAEVLNCLE